MKKNIIKFTLLLTLACRGVLGVDEQGRLSPQSVEHSDAFIRDALELAVDGSHVCIDVHSELRFYKEHCLLLRTNGKNEYTRIR
jgi:flagellar motor component MotA